jgi:hypothetical protein
VAKYALISRIKLTLLKMMEAVGTTASNMASNAKLRANEIKLENRRREILTDFSLRAFEMWQKGVPLPASLSEMLSELSEIEDRLSVLRAQKYARVSSESTPETPLSKEEEACEPVVSCEVGDADSNSAKAVPCELWETPAQPSDAPTDESTQETENEPVATTAADTDATAGGVSDQPQA